MTTGTTPATTPSATVPPHQHGVKGVYYGGAWLDLEECAGTFSNPPDCSHCPVETACPRSRSRTVQSKKTAHHHDDHHHDDKLSQTPTADYDICIIGAGCIGAAVARELSKYLSANNQKLSILWLEAADDVSQGATKGNSGIVHAGYDDTPGTNRAAYCWKGNQMFVDLDKQLRFGYQQNGSLVVAFNEADMQELHALKRRGEQNGLERLRIIGKDELFQMEPHIQKDAVAALYSPDAGNVIPYEFTIALAENAVDNGVELRIRRRVVDIKVLESKDSNENNFQVTAEYWEPDSYIQAVASQGKASVLQVMLLAVLVLASLQFLLTRFGLVEGAAETNPLHLLLLIGLYIATNKFPSLLGRTTHTQPVTRATPISQLAQQAGAPQGTTSSATAAVTVQDMLVGGSGSPRVMGGTMVAREIIKCRYVINCAGGASDTVARLIGDESFKIKPRLGDYILLNRNQGHLAKHTLFPCPDPKLGKGVLVQTTLWGNLILGPTARDMHEPQARDMSPQAVQEYILSKCKHLVPSFDAKETIHAFAGARAKSDRGDWIIEPSHKNPHFIHVAGIDSPGLAGSPAIALQVVHLLQQAGLSLTPNPNFKSNRAPIIIPKDGLKGLKMGPIGKNDSPDGTDERIMAQNVICKCERVTELEVVRAMQRSLPIDSSQGIRKRTRAGMGHCQGDPNNYACEARVRAIIARENGVPVSQVGGRPWPATSTLSTRWIGEEEKQALAQRKEQAA